MALLQVLNYRVGAKMSVRRSASLSIFFIACWSLLACDSSYDDEVPNLGAELQGECGSTDQRIGSSATFSTLAHEVAGTVTIIDDCTLEITGFNYDGQGPAVYFYAARDADYLSENAFVLGDQLNGPRYTNETIRLKLPENRTLADMNTISVWCVDFRANFGEAVF